MPAPAPAHAPAHVIELTPLPAAALPGLPAPAPAPAAVRGEALAALRARVRRIERGGGPDDGSLGGAARAVVPLGLAALDDHLPGGGLPLDGLHEIEGDRAEWDDGAATGFCLALLARLAAARPGGRLLWVARWGDLYAPGLAAFGVDPGRLIQVRAGTEAEVLWVLEEALRCPRLAAVVGEIDVLGRGAGRRLQLAAERGGVSALVLRRRLRPGGQAAGPSAALTRWRVAPEPAPISGAVSGAASGVAGRRPGRPRWQVELLRCRGAAHGRWLLELDDAAGGFALAAPLRDRSSAPAPAASEARSPSGGEPASWRLAG